MIRRCIVTIIHANDDACKINWIFILNYKEVRIRLHCYLKERKRRKKEVFLSDCVPHYVCLMH